jgi:hypothetical protein
MWHIITKLKDNYSKFIRKGFLTFTRKKVGLTILETRTSRVVPDYAEAFTR